MDVTFTVKNRATAAPRIRSLLRETFPSLHFSVSDDFEARFDKIDREPTLREQVLNLANLAAHLGGALEAIAARMQSEDQAAGRKKPGA